jgi:hypothetical protein
MIPKDPLSQHAFQEATKLAASGYEFAHLVKIMNPDHALRLKCFVQDLPDTITSKTDYGRSVKAEITKKSPKRK